MGFANPIWLWGLSGLLIPLAIHLLSRKEGTVIPIGSLRHLQDSNTQQFKSLRLNEILLLILRCLLIMLIVFFLSGLQWKSASNQKWVLVEESLKENSQAKSLVDSLKKQGYEQRSLSAGFSQSENQNSSPINYWQLLDELKTKEVADEVIISSARAEGFKGLRLEKENIQWITIPSAAKEYLVSAKKISGDSITARVGSVKNENTQYTTLKTKSLTKSEYYQIKNDSVLVTAIDTVTIWVVADAEFEYDKKIVLASLSAIQKIVPSKMNIVEETTDLKELPKADDWIIWLSEKEIYSVNARGKLLFKNLVDHKLIEQRSANEWVLTSRLNQDKALNENFSLQLSAILFPAKEEWQIADSKDQRTMPEEMLWANASEEKNSDIKKATMTTLERPLLLLILILLVTERLVSYRRNQ